MKYRFLKAFFITTLLVLTGCSSPKEKAKLTFGNHISNDPLEIAYSQLTEKMENKESMLVASYYASIGSCECQTIFCEVLKEYIAETHYAVYLFNSQEIEGSKDEYKFLNLGYSSPILYIINKGRIAQTLKYTQKANKNLFENKEALATKIDKYFKKPDYYYVDDEYMTNNLYSQFRVGVCYIRESCPDCKYLIPNFMIPFTNDRDLPIEIWIFDMDPYYNTEQYQTIKDKYHLSESSDEKFGYLNGVVPTTQYYKDGMLVSASVYFNDKIELDSESGNYKIVESYYTEERINNLEYLEGASTLINRTIEKEEVVSGYWLPSYASVIHNQLIAKFYCQYFF